MERESGPGSSACGPQREGAGDAVEHDHGAGLRSDRSSPSKAMRNGDMRTRRGRSNRNGRQTRVPALALLTPFINWSILGSDRPLSLAAP